MEHYLLQGSTLTVPEYKQAQKDVNAFKNKRNRFIKEYEPSMLNCCEGRPY